MLTRMAVVASLGVGVCCAFLLAALDLGLAPSAVRIGRLAQSNPLSACVSQLAAESGVQELTAQSGTSRLSGSVVADGVIRSNAPDSEETTWHCVSHAVGWPLRAVVVTSVATTPESVWVRYPRSEGGGISPFSGHPPIAQESGVTILWPGLLVNLAVSAAAVVLAVEAVAFAIRRRPRLGRCTRCDYPLHGLKYPLCPECGHAQFRDSHPPPIAL